MPKIKSELSVNSSGKVRQLFNIKYLRQREMGIKFPIGHNDQLHKSLYKSIQPLYSWDHHDKLSSAMHGGVFNLEYSPDG